MLAETMVANATRGKAAFSALAEASELEGIAERLVARGASAWPDVKISPKDYATHVALRVDDAPDIARALDELHAEDLWLALACGKGNRAAIAAFEKRLVGVVNDALARLKKTVAVEDVAQVLREKLLVAPAGSSPKVLDYSGRGPLAGWLRISAVRTALSMRRHGDAASADPVSREVLLEVPADGGDPELDHLRRRYAGEFKSAFEVALSKLTTEERNILRLSIVDGLSIDEIGAVFSVHRATAARWLESARESVQAKTRAELREQHKIGPRELKSMMAYIRSQLDLSIQRLLGPESESASTTAKAPASLKKRKPARSKRKA